MMHPAATIPANRLAPTTRGGFTLFELLVVAAVIILIGAIIFPALLSTTETQQLVSSGDTMRTFFARSRNKAMRDGQTLALRYEIGGNKFLIEPWDTGDSNVESNASASSFNLLGQLQETLTDDRNVIKRLLQQVQTLPGDTVFAGGTQTFDSREFAQFDPTLNPNAANVDSSSVTESVGGVWSRPILFYPDGSTSQSEVRIGTEDLQIFVLVRIRGLTGIAYVTEIMTHSELVQLDQTRITQ